MKRTDTYSPGHFTVRFLAKWFLCTVLCLGLIVSSVACGKKEETPDQKRNPSRAGWGECSRNYLRVL